MCCNTNTVEGSFLESNLRVRSAIVQIRAVESPDLKVQMRTIKVFFKTCFKIKENDQCPLLLDLFSKEEIDNNNKGV